MDDTVFISDLHLAPERPEIISLFLKFADEVAAKADKLYILGDFLEYWLGDDNPALSMQPVFEKLYELATEHETEIYFMHGNRDFLIGEDFAKRYHLRLLNDPHIISIQGRRTLLLHGDTLCTDDIEYQKFRSMVRSQEWQQNFLSKSLDERIAIAEQLRQASRESTAEKDQVIMDVNQQDTERLFIESDVDLMIHGHTHRPNIHNKTVNKIDTTRIVLGDWYEAGSYLRINDDSDFKIQTFQ